MPGVIPASAWFCTAEDGSNRIYVSNSGRIAGVSDRVDLWKDAGPFERSSETVQLNTPRVNRDERSDVLRHDSDR